MPEHPLKSVDRNSAAFLEMRREQAKVDLMNKIQELGGTNGVSQWRLEHRGQPVDLAGQNLEGVDFSGANLEGANFYEANCAGARFDMAGLRLACFVAANLEGAGFDNLTDARSANFYGARGLSAELQATIVADLGKSWSPVKTTLGQRRSDSETMHYDVTFRPRQR
ncbi:MAG: pentapeptide repeat-containing protein [Candidatus Kerfeldbacteria bacterium]|nr:pentapeptide repeat-containing protein [Candidatus Kerfeldbacteria bacterium]